MSYARKWLASWFLTLAIALDIDIVKAFVVEAIKRVPE